MDVEGHFRNLREAPRGGFTSAADCYAKLGEGRWAGGLESDLADEVSSRFWLLKDDLALTRGESSTLNFIIRSQQLWPIVRSSYGADEALSFEEGAAILVLLDAFAIALELEVYGPDFLFRYEDESCVSMASRPRTRRKITPKVGENVQDGKSAAPSAPSSGQGFKVTRLRSLLRNFLRDVKACLRRAPYFMVPRYTPQHSRGAFLLSRARHPPLHQLVIRPNPISPHLAGLPLQRTIGIRKGHEELWNDFKASFDTPGVAFLHPNTWAGCANRLGYDVPKNALLPEFENVFLAQTWLRSDPACANGRGRGKKRGGDADAEGAAAASAAASGPTPLPNTLLELRQQTRARCGITGEDEASASFWMVPPEPQYLGDDLPRGGLLLGTSSHPSLPSLEEVELAFAEALWSIEPRVNGGPRLATAGMRKRAAAKRAGRLAETFFKL